MPTANRRLRPNLVRVYRKIVRDWYKVSDDTLAGDDDFGRRRPPRTLTDDLDLQAKFWWWPTTRRLPGSNQPRGVDAADSGTPKWPCLVYVHGGHWRQSDGRRSRHVPDENDARRLFRLFARRGVVVCSVQYRGAAPRFAKQREFYMSRGLKLLSGDVPFGKAPAAMRDVFRALRYVRELAKRGTIPVDPDRIGLLGTSAGASICELVGLWNANRLDLGAITNVADPSGEIPEEYDMDFQDERIGGEKVVIDEDPTAPNTVVAPKIVIVASSPSAELPNPDGKRSVKWAFQSWTDPLPVPEPEEGGTEQEAYAQLRSERWAAASAVTYVKSVSIDGTAVDTKDNVVPPFLFLVGQGDTLTRNALTLGSADRDGLVPLINSEVDNEDAAMIPVGSTARAVSFLSYDGYADLSAGERRSIYRPFTGHSNWKLPAGARNMVNVVMRYLARPAIGWAVPAVSAKRHVRRG